jgi:hypothetical protein
VAALVVEFDSVPPPLTLQLTPAAFLSFVTVAVSVVVSAPSMVLAAAATDTLTTAEDPPVPEPELPPQPASNPAMASILNKF